MLKSLVHIGFAWRSSEARRQRRQVEDRLRAEAGRSRIEPSRALHSRTLAALNDVSTLPAPAVSMTVPLRRALTGGHALALASLMVIGAVAVYLGVPHADDGTGAPGPAPTLAVFDTMRFDSVLNRQLRGLQETWESPLRTEARLIARDARIVSTNVLASVSLLAAWDRRDRPEGRE